jgi:hypothetical protein
MSKTTIVVDTAESAEVVKSVLDLRSDNGVRNIRNLVRLLNGINGGTYAGGTCRVIRSAVAATADRRAGAGGLARGADRPAGG